jgi:hypothetical protein
LAPSFRTLVAIGGQHGIGTIEARTVFRAATTADA